MDATDKIAAAQRRARPSNKKLDVMTTEELVKWIDSRITECGQWGVVQLDIQDMRSIANRFEHLISE